MDVVRGGERLKTLGNYVYQNTIIIQRSIFNKKEERGLDREN